VFTVAAFGDAIRALKDASWSNAAERVGFVPANQTHINNSGLISLARNAKTVKT
jgi:hypothetical protein